NFDLRQAGENVEFRECQTVDSVDASGIAKAGKVNPSAASRATGHRAELVTHFAQMRSHLVVEFRRKGSASYARAVGLGDAEDGADAVRADASTDRCASRYG